MVRERVTQMPRLEQKRSNTGLYVLLVLVLLIVAFLLLEITSTINLIANFGAA